MPTTGVPPFERKVSFFACSTSSSSVVGRRLDARLLQQRLVVEQADGRVRTGMPISLPSIVIALTQAGAMSSNSSIGILGR